MSPEGAERAITISALIVMGVYVYRRITEGSGLPTQGRIKQLAGQGSPAPVAVFVTAWGFTFLMCSIIAAASPGLGGGMAVLIAVGDVLGNGTQVAKDINTKVKPASSTAKPSSSSTTGSKAG